MYIIKDKQLLDSYDYFSKKGCSFNLKLYKKLLIAKGINPDDKLEIRK